MTLRQIHGAAGLIGLAVFLATGQYIRAVFPEIYAGDETIRYTMNATHVYLMFAALLNGALSLDLGSERDGWRGRFVRAGSGLVVASVVLLILGFHLEATQGGPMRPITGFGVLLAFVGVLLRVVAVRPVVDPDQVR